MTTSSPPLDHHLGLLLYKNIKACRTTATVDSDAHKSVWPPLAFTKAGATHQDFPYFSSFFTLFSACVARNWPRWRHGVKDIHPFALLYLSLSLHLIFLLQHLFGYTKFSHYFSLFASTFVVFTSFASLFSVCLYGIVIFWPLHIIS